MGAVLAGLLTGFSLLLVIGAQNAFVLRQGIARSHVGLVVAVCTAGDIVLIALGVAGLGAVVRAHGDALRAIALVGTAYVLWFAFRSFRAALHPGALTASDRQPPTRRAAALAVLGLTFLNPHVYLDTVLLLGTIGSAYGAARWWFALGAGLASTLWFSTIGFGARVLSPLMARPATWRALDAFVGAVMLLVAAGLLRTALG